MVLKAEQHGLRPVKSGFGFDVAAAERALRDQWAAHASSSEEALLRERALNLLVIVEGADSLERAQAALEELMVSHPCRALCLVLLPDAPARTTETYVAARCALAQGKSEAATRRHLCGEQIVLVASADAQLELISAAAALVSSDLPTFAWWRAEPCLDGEFFARLSEMCDRIILDLAMARDAKRHLRAIARLVPTLEETAITDLEWTRTLDWRASLAECYDVAHGREAIQCAQHIKITCVPRHNMNLVPQAALLAGWLISRLEWRVDEQQRQILAPSGAVRFSFDRQQETARVEPGSLTSIEFEAESGAKLSLRLTPDGEHIETVASESVIGRTIRCTDRSETCLLQRELTELARDAIYERAVVATSAICDLY
ncbi:MAG: hypothetical protein C4334_12945 [Pyrinomonas sp.]|uniref:glucose-6-phosphate dehydrogenase assembly protein OpcA n=1 Tax=Pyrinomonas sp. TaxID=2080306 RepID=UPI00331E990F